MSKRPNGTGSVYKRGSTWTARVVDHWEPSENKAGLKPVWKTKGGFAKKKDALNYCAELYKEKRREHPPKEFKQDFDLWKAAYSDRVTASTMAGYVAAFKHFDTLHYVKIDRISANDLQSCIDECKNGKRTKQMMRVVAGLVFKYAIDDDQIQKNNAANLYIGDDETTHYEPLTEEELNRFAASDNVYAAYVVGLCYLGYRPTEFFKLKKEDYRTEGDTHYFVGGIKTDAGKNRIVTVPDRIIPIIEARLSVEGTDLLFPRYNRNRKGEFVGYGQMPTAYFCDRVFKPLAESLGITGKVPYATRHTYSNKIKAVSGADRDKAELMGHATYETTKKHYQTTSLDELKAITDQVK